MSNDLQKYYRRIHSYVSLPSGDSYYNDKVISLSDSGEVGIKSMTSDDEISLKNPDMLLNGEAVKGVLLSCVDGLKKPEMLLSNDVDILLMAVRAASYTSNNTYISTCPKCEHENHFSVDVTAIMDGAGKLEDEYVIELDSGLCVHVRPYTYSDQMHAMKVIFEQQKIQKNIESTLDTKDALKLFDKSINMMSNLNANLIVSCIYRLTDGDGLDIECNTGNLKDTHSLLSNIPVADAVAIDKKLKEINDIGIDRSVTVTCQNEECDAEWKSEVETNPVNFSITS